MCDSAHIPMVVYLHAEQTELTAGKYNDQGDEIISWCAANNVPVIKDLDHCLTASDFRDNIHLSAQGQRNMANSSQKIFKTIALCSQAMQGRPAHCHRAAPIRGRVFTLCKTAPFIK